MSRAARSTLYLAIILLPIFAYQLYKPGETAGFFFDDFPNLIGLSNVQDINSALAFVSDPKGGPLGRPVAMASFLINTFSWDSAPEDFTFTNISIHLLNGLLLAWCCFRVGLLLKFDQVRTGWFSITVAALWLSQPLLVSASLMIVQRMTTLAATFCFLGSLLFLYGFSILDKQRRLGYWLMTLGVAGGTALSVLTKENGILLPLMLLILQATILRDHAETLGSSYRRWRLCFLILPSILVFGYLLYLLPRLPGAYLSREFTLSERVLTEGRILIHYLALLLVPVRSQLGPFNDDFSLSSTLLDPISTAVCWASILALLVYAIVVRKRHAIFSFAVLWFFAGHTIESTIVPLELYFEHRNYFPSIGPVVAVVYFCVHFFRVQWHGIALLSSYLILIAWVCHSVAGVFGDKKQSAFLWAQEHPDSLRAVQNLTLAYSALGDPGASASAIQAYSDRHADDVGVALQSVQLACLTGNADSRLTVVEHRNALFKKGRLSSVVCGAIEKISILALENACPGLPVERILSVAEQILMNKNISGAREVSYCLHDAQAMLYFNLRDFDATMKHLEAAFTFRSYPEVAEHMVEVPISAGRFDLARQNISKIRARMPDNVFQAKIWKSKITELEELISRNELKN